MGAGQRERAVGAAMSAVTNITVAAERRRQLAEDVHEAETALAHLRIQAARVKAAAGQAALAKARGEPEAELEFMLHVNSLVQAVLAAGDMAGRRSEARFESLMGRAP